MLNAQHKQATEALKKAEVPPNLPPFLRNGRVGWTAGLFDPRITLPRMFAACCFSKSYSHIRRLRN